MIGFEGGIFGLIVLIADIWALIHVLQSASSTGGKVLWILVIVVLPVLGFLAWLIFGPRKVA